MFEYKQEPTNPAFPTQVEYLEIGDVTHTIFSWANAAVYSGIEFYPQEGLPAAEWIVPEGQYFVMGDNRDHSDDSSLLGICTGKKYCG